MKVRRKPKVGGKWSDTDVRDPLSIVDDWKPGTTFVLDGTIDKEGARHSLIGIDISADDVQALIIKLIENYKQKIIHLQEKLLAKEIENDQRKEAFQALDTLIDPFVHPDLFHEKEKDLPSLFHKMYATIQFGLSENITDERLNTIHDQEE